MPNGMREMNHQYSFRFVEPGKNVHHGVIWFEYPNYHSMPMRNDTQETSIVRKTEVVSVLRKHIGITNRFQNSSFSLDVKPQTNTYFPSNRSTSHLRSNTSQNDTHEKRNGQLWNPTYGHGGSSYLRFVHTTDDTKRHEQEYRGNESKWGNAKSDSYSPPQFRRHGSSCRKKQAEEDVPAMSPHEAAKPVS